MIAFAQSRIMTGVRYTVLALVILTALVAGWADASRGSHRTVVPVVELTTEQQPRVKAAARAGNGDDDGRRGGKGEDPPLKASSQRPKVKKREADRPETGRVAGTGDSSSNESDTSSSGGTEGARLAPVPAPVPAGDRDDDRGGGGNDIDDRGND